MRAIFPDLLRRRRRPEHNPTTPVSAKRLFLDHLHVIDQVVLFIARRHHLSREEADDLASAVKLKIIENDYEALRNFRGDSSLRTYLATIANRHFLDTRIAQWGKWRPSAQARRLGPAALVLDRLMSRDGLSLNEAVETMRANGESDLSWDELVAIGRQLTVRPRRRFSGPEELNDHPSSTATENGVDATEVRAEAERIAEALADALGQLGTEDRLILRMRFQDNVPVSRISRMLGLDQKRLYRRLDHVMKTLRTALEARGVSRERVAAIAGHPAADVFDALDRSAAGNIPGSPSL